MRSASAQCGHQVQLQLAATKWVSSHSTFGWNQGHSTCPFPQAQASCYTVGRKTAKFNLSGAASPRAARIKRSSGARAESGATVKAAAVAEPPRVDLVPKPVTSVLHDLTRFHGLPSLGKQSSALQPPTLSCARSHSLFAGTTSDFHEAERCFTTLLGVQDLGLHLR